jgi:hypothetical protein
VAHAIVEDGWTVSSAAAVVQVAAPTARRGAERSRQTDSVGMVDRSRPRLRRCPERTPRSFPGGSCACAGTSGCEQWRSPHARHAPSTVYAVIRR